MTPTPTAARADALAARAAASLRAGWTIEAERLGREALVLDRDEPTALHVLSVLYSLRGDWQDAVALLSRLAERRPDDLAVQGDLAVALKRAGRQAEAEAAFAKVVGQADHPALACEYAGLLTDRGDHAAADSILHPVLERFPDLAPAHLERARALWAAGRPADAITALRTGLARCPQDVALLRTLGQRLIETKDFAAAVDVLRAVLALQPAHAVGTGLVLALAGCGRFAEAEALHWQSVAERGGLPSLSLETDRLIAHGRIAEAIAAFPHRRPALPRVAPSLAALLAGGRGDARPVRAVAIEMSNWLTRPDLGELERDLGLAVAGFRIADDDPPPVTDRTLFIVPHSVGWIDPARFARLAELRPRDVVVAWLYDNHHAFAENDQVAARCHAVFPTHAFASAYLHGGGGTIGPAVPLAVTQWARRELDDCWRATQDMPRTDALYGQFHYYPLAAARNAAVFALAGQDWAAGVRLDLFEGLYHKLSPAARFASWRGHKVSLHLPVAADLSMRVFDALAAGHIPIVADGVRDLDAVIPRADQATLPILRLADDGIDAVRAAHAAALAAFDAGGDAAVQRRHAYVRERHLLTHRIQEIVGHVGRMLGSA